MSHTNRPEPRGIAGRPRRKVRLENLESLEGRQLLTPVVAVNAPVATFVPSATPTNANLGTVTIALTGSITASAAPLTSVAQLTSANSFGGDIVRIEAGPGGDFGKGVYAISRGAGENADPTSRDPTIAAPINRPGTIYRVDPATGRTSVFFDLNTVISQIQPGGNAGNGSSPGSGLVNNYDLAFDSEGVFDGKPSLFVSSLSQTDPNKNVIYRIGPDGSFMGIYIRFTAGASAQNFVRQPSAVLVPPVEQQNFLKGLFVGQGNGGSALNGTDQGGFQALFFDANVFQPGQDLSGATLPNGVSTTSLNFGPQVALTAANSSYGSPDYSVFTDFGTPGAGGVNASPGLSGVQGLQGELLIGTGATIGGVGGATIGGGGTIVTGFGGTGGAKPDLASAIITPFRRFQDAAFDQFGYFSYGEPTTTAATGTGAPIYQGSLFVSDLATGLAVTVTPIAPFAVAPINVPIQGPGGPISVELGPDGKTVVPVFTDSSTTGGNIGGRIVRIDPAGVVHLFADGFHTSGAQDANSFLQSSLSITFSADGTTLYAADDDGIWQFKTVTDVADATSGSLIGLNDLRTFGVPYDGQDSAVAVLDTGVDSFTPNFRGRVATGFNVLTNGAGNDDQAAANNGHGTLVAGVIAQFVPQATLNPVNVFTPNQVVPSIGGSTGGSIGGAGGSISANVTTPQNIYTGLNYISNNPFVADPIRPNTVDRVIATNLAFGTTTTYPTETGPFKSFPQVTIAFKNEFQKFRQLGIAPIAAAGQFGGVATGASTGGSVGGGTAGGGSIGDVNGISFPAVLNEVISVTGSYSYPYAGDAHTPPTDPGTGVVPRPPGPILLYGFPVTGTISAGTTAGNVTTSDLLVFKDKLLASSNRSLTTDYTAPEVDVPTWARLVSSVSLSGTTGGTVGGVGGNPLTGFNDFQEGGTSLSSAIVTGSYALLTSALDYWSVIQKNNGVTIDGYLNTPVGTHQLNFGKGGIEDLSAYANPDGINSILQWTSVPATDAPNTLDLVNPPNLFHSTSYRQFARIDIGNAIAAVEGSIALNYLFAHNSFDLIDANKNGLITAQELQNFVDNAANTGHAEEGAMARFLGGTGRIPTTGQQPTTAGETPDQPDALSRRFNFFDYAADGQLNGAVSIDQYRLLAKNLLPAPDAFTITNRAKSASSGFLISPTPDRNISDLQHTLGSFVLIPKNKVARFRNISPAKFGVGRGQLPALSTPTFTLFSDGLPHTVSKATARHLQQAATTPVRPVTPTPAPAPVASTTPKPATTPTSTKIASTAISPTTINPGSDTSANAYIAALGNLAQGTTAKQNPSTILSPPRQAGTPAAASASGVGTSVTSSSSSGTAATAPSTAASATSSTTTTTFSSANPSSTSGTPIVTTQVVAQTPAQAAQNSATVTSPSVTSRNGTHVAPPPHRAARVKTPKSNNAFNFWNPWESIKKIVKK